jgi:hypothetical protein
VTDVAHVADDVVVTRELPVFVARELRAPIELRPQSAICLSVANTPSPQSSGTYADLH